MRQRELAEMVHKIGENSEFGKAESFVLAGNLFMSARWFSLGTVLQFIHDLASYGLVGTIIF